VIVEPIDRCSAVCSDAEISNDRDGRCICDGHIGMDPIRGNVSEIWVK
jgi:hypothetical protein